MLKQEIILEITIFITFLIASFLLLVLNVLISFGINWYFSDFQIHMFIPSLIYGLKFVFIENEAKGLLHYWHIIFFFAIMGVIHLPIFISIPFRFETPPFTVVKSAFIRSGRNSVRIRATQKRTWQQWIIRFFILLIANAVILLIVGILIVSIDCLILLL
ncbi:hypothetical protein EII21_11040 [Conchiformibius steedae]|uniref:Uncharacterized protein n=2 Tax=Conchiformibius steedae TaxID=153493 RepID=A0A3P2A020_9NEIS|nr:hypothetical protein EII21_11040 [Conchiformibius steedae]